MKIKNMVYIQSDYQAIKAVCFVFGVCVCVCVCVCAGPVVDPRKVLIIAGHHNWIVAAYAHFVICYR